MSFPEIVLLLFVALILFGPEDLPVVARALGKIIYQIRKVSDELTKEFRDAVDSPKNLINQTLDNITKPSPPRQTTPTRQTLDQNEWKPETADNNDANRHDNIELLTYDDKTDKPETNAAPIDDPLQGLPDSIITYEKKTEEKKN